MDIINSIGILDLIFIVILSISVLLGIIRGAIREVLSLVGLGASVYLAFAFSEMLSNSYTSKFLEDPKISYIVTFVLIIVATLFCVTLINLLFSSLLKASGLSFVNRIIGAVFGLLRGALICSILVMIISFVPGVDSKSWWQDSSLAPGFKQLTKATFKYLPKEVSDYFNSAKESVGKVAKDLVVPTNTAPNNTQKDNTKPVPSPEPTRPTLEPMPDAPQKNTLILESFQEEAPQQ